uniref:Uncharacterized protein n=1 Tax=Utricularia reniformis TaxID=192314 RepID=A0A1Y0B1Y2_9LAMI|nr:hypothetical protein AEK19_MT1170 [Utricularia reniformis]ART31383.1 hypothetical protein AEK19_MT1170 [Utricularia reniformis]
MTNSIILKLLALLMYLLSLQLRWTDQLPGNPSQYETPNSNGSTDDLGTEPDSETTERLIPVNKLLTKRLF